MITIFQFELIFTKKALQIQYLQGFFYWVVPKGGVEPPQA